MRVPDVFGAGPRPMFALFNRLSGAFVLLIGRVGDEPPRINETHYVARAVEIDPDTQMVKGTVDAFEIVAQAEQPPVIDEYSLNARCGDKILKRYPQHRQINILSDLLETLVTDLQPTGAAVEAFLEMRAYIAECQERNARYKAAYAASPDFVFLDKGSLEQRVLDELEGGLHEVIGGPLGTAATPFS